MSEFNWDEHPIVNASPKAFSWDDHPIITKAPPANSKIDSALEGVAQGGTLGYANQIRAVTEPAAFKIMNALTGNDVKPDDYVTARDSYDKQTDQKKSDNPGSYLAGNVAGSAATMAPFLKGAQGATLLARALSAAKTGAALGALQNTPDKTGEVGNLDLGDRAKNAGVGAALGGILQPAGEAISNIPSALSGLAERRAAAALGAERATVKKLGADAVQSVGRNALDQGVVTPLATTEDMISRNDALQSSAGKAMGDVYSKIDSLGNPQFNPLKAAADVALKVGDFYRSPINKSEVSQFENTLESILMRGDKNIPLEDAQSLKEELGKVANWKNNLNITDKERMAREAYGIVSQHIDDAVKNSGAKGNLLGQLSDAKGQYSMAKKADELLTNRQAREAGNQFFGLKDTIGGGAGAAIGASLGGPPGAALGGLAGSFGSKLAGKYGNQIVATGADAVSKALLNIPQYQQLAQSSPQAFAAVVNNVINNQKNKGMPQGPMNKTNPLSIPTNANSDSASNTPTKGPVKWMMDGFQNLLNHIKDPKAKAQLAQNKDALMNDPKSRNLLISASSLKPGSSAMDNIFMQLDSGDDQ